MRRTALRTLLSQPRRHERCYRFQNFSTSTRALLPRISDNRNSLVGDSDAATDTHSVRRRRSAQVVKTRSGVPPPPELPAWFLEHNVSRHAGQDGTISASDSSVVVRHDAGQSVLLSVPFTRLGQTASVPGADANPDTESVPERLLDTIKSRTITKQDEDKEAPDHLGQAYAFSDRQSPDGPAIQDLLRIQLLTQSCFDLAANEDSRTGLRHARDLVISSTTPLTPQTLDHLVRNVAQLTNASLVRINANDIAELAGDYIDGSDRASGAISSLPYDVYEGCRAQQNDNSNDDNEQDSDDNDNDTPSHPMSGNVPDLRAFLEQNKKLLGQALGAVKVVGMSVSPTSFSPADLQPQMEKSSSKEEDDSDSPTLDRWQMLKLDAFLDNLLGASALNAPDAAPSQHDFLRSAFRTTDLQSLEMSSMRRSVARHLHTTWLDHSQVLGVSGKVESPAASSTPEKTRTIVQLTDIHAIRDTNQGEMVVKCLLKALTKRRKNGESITLIGTASAESNPVSSFDNHDDDFFNIDLAESTNATATPALLSSNQDLSQLDANMKQILTLNLRNIADMIRQCGFSHATDMFSSEARQLLSCPGTSPLGVAVMTSDWVRQIVTIANGLRSLYTNDSELKLAHIAWTVSILGHEGQRDGTAQSQSFPGPTIHAFRAQERGSPEDEKTKSASSRAQQIDAIRKTATKHEQRLLPGIADPASIKTTFDNVHAPATTIDALRTVTSLSMLRPDAFKYGVLANDRLPGLLLYGPPGTGKTMLAKAVAKDSQAIVLEVSGAQIYEKYVGEGEKMVRAVFGLAKKLSPCIVFIDEADALFGTRGSAGSRVTHREIINQFLREWDGMDDHGVFVMVATNRPFDLDDAVLRRLPRRILVDLPSAIDREKILAIHLKEESLSENVSLEKLAKQTPFYSGSDLKNMCVAAALTAVKQENELMAKHKGDDEFKLPERRVLNMTHFEAGMQEISASISEDMGSLRAIKKFDEQYGDRKSRRKKEGYGFGDLVERDESAARIRGDDTPARA